MKQIFDGVFVEEHDDDRIYIIDAEFSEYIKSMKSKESARQEITPRQKNSGRKILDLIKRNDFHAELDKDEQIHVKTEDPVRLVKVLCDKHFIEIGQATAIIAHEIEHIKNPAMQKMVSGRKRLKEIREVVIRYRIVLSQSARKALELEDMRSQKDRSRG